MKTNRSARRLAGLQRKLGGLLLLTCLILEIGLAYDCCSRPATRCQPACATEQVWDANMAAGDVFMAWR
jgi:hypothetical protein